MPDYRPTGSGIEQQVIRMTVEIKVRYCCNLPAAGKRWTRGSADHKVVIKVPNCRLTCGSIVKKKIGPGVAVEIRDRHDWRDADVIDVFSAVKCGRVCDVSTGVVGNDSDVIADLVLVWIADKGIKRVAYCDVG